MNGFADDSGHSIKSRDRRQHIDGSVVDGAFIRYDA
jgi:hypothetical protein